MTYVSPFPSRRPSTEPAAAGPSGGTDAPEPGPDPAGTDPSATADPVEPSIPDLWGEPDRDRPSFIRPYEPPRTGRRSRPPAGAGTAVEVTAPGAVPPPTPGPSDPPTPSTEPDPSIEADDEPDRRPVPRDREAGPHDDRPGRQDGHDPDDHARAGAEVPTEAIVYVDLTEGTPPFAPDHHRDLRDADRRYSSRDGVDPGRPDHGHQHHHAEETGDGTRTADNDREQGEPARPDAATADGTEGTGAEAAGVEAPAGIEPIGPETDTAQSDTAQSDTAGDDRSEEDSSTEDRAEAHRGEARRAEERGADARGADERRADEWDPDPPDVGERDVLDLGRVITDHPTGADHGGQDLIATATEPTAGPSAAHRAPDGLEPPRSAPTLADWARGWDPPDDPHSPWDRDAVDRASTDTATVGPPAVALGVAGTEPGWREDAWPAFDQTEEPWPGTPDRTATDLVNPDDREDVDREPATGHHQATGGGGELPIAAHDGPTDLADPDEADLDLADPDVVDTDPDPTGANLGLVDPDVVDTDLDLTDTDLGPTDTDLINPHVIGADVDLTDTDLIDPDVIDADVDLTDTDLIDAHVIGADVDLTDTDADADLNGPADFDLDLTGPASDELRPSPAPGGPIEPSLRHGPDDQGPGEADGRERWWRLLAWRASTPEGRRQILIRWWWVATLALILPVVIALAVRALTPVRYESSATVLLRTPASASLFPDGGTLASDRTVTAEMAYVGTGDFRLEAARTAASSDPVEITVDDPGAEVPSTLRFTAASRTAEGAAATAQGWAETYVAARHRLDVNELRAHAAANEAGLARLETERDRLGVELADAERALAAAPDDSTLTARRDTVQAQVDRVDLMSGTVMAELARAQAGFTAYDGAAPGASLAVSAIEPTEPASTGSVGYAAFGLLAGLVLAGLSVAAAAAFDDRVGSAGEVEPTTGLDPLGRLPGVSTQWLPVSVPPGSALANRLDDVADQLDRRRDDPEACQVVAVSSARSGEGRTSLAARLSVVLAGRGHNVLVIDGDLRRPQLAAALGAPPGPGLADYLGTNDVAVEHCLHRVRRRAHLVSLPAGTLPPGRSSLDLLDSPDLDELVDQLRPFCHTILIDTPPILDGDDAARLAETADVVVVSVMTNRTRGRAVRRAVQRLSRSAPVIGAVVIETAPTPMLMGRTPPSP
ncbi:MAG: hypothetical protein ACK5PP_19520 [Acidimicrobiales bacterium]